MNSKAAEDLGKALMQRPNDVMLRKESAILKVGREKAFMLLVIVCNVIS